MSSMQGTYMGMGADIDMSPVPLTQSNTNSFMHQIPQNLYRVENLSHPGHPSMIPHAAASMKRPPPSPSPPPQPPQAQQQQPPVQTQPISLGSHQMMSGYAQQQQQQQQQQQPKGVGPPGPRAPGSHGPPKQQQQLPPPQSVAYNFKTYPSPVSTSQLRESAEHPRKFTMHLVSTAIDSKR
jgi:hypothetical protein